MSSYYYDYPSMGLPDDSTLNRLSDFIAQMNHNILINGGDYTLELFNIVESARRVIAAFYQVPHENICFISNTTEGLGIIASSLRRSKVSVNVLVPDIEFISSALVWQDNSDSISFVKTDDGKVSIDAVKNQLENANILCMSAVQEVSGYRFSYHDLLKQHSKRKNEFWIVDGIQEAGAFYRDLEGEQIDAYIVGGHKWLNNPFGLGFMYISNRLLEGITPDYYGYLNLKEPNEGWISYLESRDRNLEDLNNFDITKEAKSFETGGMVQILGALMLRESLEHWTKFGVKKTEDHLIRLHAYFKEKLNQDYGLTILGDHSDRKFWSSIITLTNKNRPYMEKQIFNQLKRENFKLSLRSIAGIGGIRIGIHFNTSFSDIDFLVNRINDIQENLYGNINRDK